MTSSSTAPVVDGTTDELFVKPGVGDSESAQALLDRIDELVGTPAYKLVSPAGARLDIPTPVMEGLLRVARAIAQGRAVTIAPQDLALTTQQAAELLHVSRPHLIKLLDQGAIPFHRTSADPAAHRRVFLRDVETYRRARRQERRAVLREMTQDAQALPGGYL